MGRSPCTDSWSCRLVVVHLGVQSRGQGHARTRRSTPLRRPERSLPGCPQPDVPVRPYDARRRGAPVSFRSAGRVECHSGDNCSHLRCRVRGATAATTIRGTLRAVLPRRWALGAATAVSSKPRARRSLRLTRWARRRHGTRRIDTMSPVPAARRVPGMPSWSGRRIATTWRALSDSRPAGKCRLRSSDRLVSLHVLSAS